MIPFALLPPIRFIVDVLKPVLVFFHDTFGVGWGTSIVLLTVCVRALLSPLMVKQFKSMKAMVAYAPQIKAVQEKYKDDKERQRQEVMKVYQENSINPFASCLPLVAQLPFFIGLFYLLKTDLRFEICGQSKVPCGQVDGAMSGAEKFLFIPDLTAKATGAVLITLVVLYIGSQLLSSVLTPSTGDRNQKMLMYGLPFIFTPFIISFPSGLIVYWITTNLWTVGQGYVLRKRLGPIQPAKGADGKPIAPPPPPDANGGGLEPAKKGLMARLAAMTEQRQAPSKEPATATAKPSGGSAKSTSTAKPKAGSGSSAPKPDRTGPPPPPPRKKKKRSGRRR
ncbi:MAG: YidC/Oxa1 family rane protein insertase [Solirubrobacteraceae bacterium]|jgi:YidC/Oxa1 family membrane protein insertase|nr:YidC/Oxa1 family rane protein insertase [Solirubrobacteraceae bacterium]